MSYVLGGDTWNMCAHVKMDRYKLLTSLVIARMFENREINNST